MITQIATLAGIMHLGMMLMMLDLLPSWAALVFIVGILASSGILAKGWDNEN